MHQGSLPWAAKIYGIVEADLLLVAEAMSLRSRLLFADAQVFGRFAQAALHEVGKVGLSDRDMAPLSVAVRRSLLWLKDRVLADPLAESTSRSLKLFICFWMEHALMWLKETSGVGQRLVAFLSFRMAQCVSALGNCSHQNGRKTGDGTSSNSTFSKLR